MIIINKDNYIRIENDSKLSNSKATKLISYVFNDLEELDDKEWIVIDNQDNEKEITLDYWYDGFHVSIKVKSSKFNITFFINNQ